MPERINKLLFIRFSSIGDIVLTTPLLRAVKQSMPETEIHYVTKKGYAELLEPNPNIDRLHLLEDDFQELATRLKAEEYDHIVDLHNSLRSRRLKMALRKPSTTFPKLNFRKWLLTRWGIDKLPRVHIVDRYFEALKPIGVVADDGGLEFYVPNGKRFNLQELPDSHRSSPVAVTIGAKQIGKQFSEAKLVSVLSQIEGPIVLLGGENEH